MPPQASPADDRTVALICARALLVVALVAASYLALTSLMGGGVAGCGPESGCNQVLSSRWAYWLGLPVSLLALPIYTFLLFLSWTIQKNDLFIGRDKSG